MKKVFMFIPAFGQQIHAATFQTTHALQQAFMAKSIAGSVGTLSFPDIAELRSMAMTIWYDTMPDVDYLLFIDADMGFSPEMVTDMMLFDEPLIGAIYPQRNLPVSWAGSGTGESHTQRRGNFMLVEGVGMGVTLIKREVVTRMLAKFPELVDTRIGLQPYAKILQSAGANRLIRLFDKMDIPERGWVSEDLSFCIRWRECGGEVWAAVGYRISHVGAYDYGACYLEHVTQMQAQAEQQAAMQKAIEAAQAQAPAPLLAEAKIVQISVPHELSGVKRLDAFVPSAVVIAESKRQKARKRTNGKHRTARR